MTVPPRVVLEPAAQDLATVEQVRGLRASTAQTTAFLRDAPGTA